MAEKVRIEQSAVIPVRKGPGGSEILLITSRDTGRWVLPKGNIKNGLSPAKSALEEAFEEAGVLGRVQKRAVGRYKYAKPEVDGGAVFRVEVFLMHVERVKDSWPEKGERRRKWVSPGKAARLVEEPKLSAMLRRVAARI